MNGKLIITILHMAVVPNVVEMPLLVKNNASQIFEETKEYQLLEWKGKGSITKHVVKHLICNHEWEVTYHSFTGCPKCASYRTENMCREIFERVFEHKFPKCRPNWLERLELDGYCEELRIAFEYNGQQHYEMIPFFHDTIEKFVERNTND